MKVFKSQLVMIPLVFILCAIACKKDKPDETPPVLSVTPVDISTVTSFIPFGADLTATQKNPAFEYVVNNPLVQVRSACDGYVEDVRLNDNFPDYELWIRTTSNSVYKLIYDHVLDLTIAKGDDIAAGEVLGVVGTGNRTELQINKTGSDNKELSYCPFDFGTADFIQQHKNFSENWCLTATVVP